MMDAQELFTILLVVCIATSALSALIGWRLGYRQAELVHAKDLLRVAAFKENAKRDFEWLRSRSDEIIAAANQIGQMSRRGSETITSAKSGDAERFPNPSAQEATDIY